MLTELVIRHFTIIDETRLAFKSGMSVITGETGAGKSVLLDALNFALGARADSKMIQLEAEQAEVVASFDISDNFEAGEFLKARDLFDEETLILRRILTKDGRSKAYINNQPVILNDLKTVSHLLVNIHGQHEHHLLLQKEAQLALVDRFAKHPLLISEVEKAFKNFQQKEHRLRELIAAQSEQDAKSALLRYQIDELAALHLQEGEFAALENEHRTLSHVNELAAKTGAMLDALYENENGALLMQLGGIEKELLHLKTLDHALNEPSRILQEAMINLKELITSMRHYHQHLNQHPERLSEIDSRLAGIYQAARKHHVAPEMLYSHFMQLQQELETFQHLTQTIAEEEIALQEALQVYQRAADKLHQSRNKAAGTLAKAASALMLKLGMQGGELKIDFENLAVPSRLGKDRIQFLVKTNPGQPFQALAQVVSGGELSRISLALEVLCAKNLSREALIFDEVDVGISGATAEIVGKLLKDLAQNAQVLCITHQPQVAAHADQHLLIEKTAGKKSVATKAWWLDQSSRVEALAKMLGGLKITEQTLKHAQEMLEMAHS